MQIIQEIGAYAGLAAVVGLPEATIAELARPAMRRAARPPPPGLLRPDRWEEYALALLALGATSTMLAESDFARPECRAFYRWLQAGGMVRDGGTVPPELAVLWQTVQEQVAKTREEPPDRLRVELDNKTLELRKRRLAREQEELQSLARDSEGMTERQCAEQMKLLLAQRAELERAQAAHGRVVASPRRFQGVREGSRD